MPKFLDLFDACLAWSNPAALMAELRRSDGTRSCLLMNEHLIGRGPQCALRLSAPYVSTQHALVRWDGHAWELLDRGSRNGTRLDGKLIEPRRAYDLTLGSVLVFGHSRETWELYDVTEPEIVVLALGSDSALASVDGVVGVPSNDDPQCTVYRDADGAWKIELADGTTRPVLDGDTIEVDGQTYRFRCPALASRTATAEFNSSKSRVTAHLAVSRDEEFVELSLEYPERSVPLGSRTQNYLLLTLARARVADIEAALPEADCGWIDKQELADGLRISPQQVDGEVFRIRRHFAHHGIEEAALAIERRPGTRQLRFGFQSIRISRL